MWKRRKSPYPPALATQIKGVVGPLKKFTTWELVARFKEWLRVLRYSRSCQESYGRAASKFSVYIGNKPLAAVTHHDVRQFLFDLTRRDISVQVVNRFLLGLRAFFDFLYMGGVVDTVAPRFIRGRAYKAPLPRVLSEGQIRKLISAASSLRDKAVIELMYATACRASEIVGMRIEHIDFERQTIVVRGKGSSRTVFFGEHARKILKLYLGKRKRGIVFLVNNPRQRGSLYRYPKQWNGYWCDYTQGRDLAKNRVIYLGPSNLTRAQAWKRFQRLVPDPNIGRPEQTQPITIEAIFRLFRSA